MILIFAVDNNWNIGVDGDMLTSISQDLKRFREITNGNILVMGRRTLEAHPNQEPLKGRINIILTRQEDYKVDDAYIISSLDELEPLLKEINPNYEKDVFVAGGGSVVRQLFDKCDKAYITKILKSYDNFDTSIINLDEEEDWKIVWESEVYEENGLEFKYVNYERIK